MMQSRAELMLATLKNPESEDEIKQGIQKFAKIIVDNIKRLTTLMRVMLDYGVNPSKEKESFAIGPLLEDLCELAAPRCQIKHIQFHRDFSQDHHNVLGNRVYIYQAFLNLVVNAIQYTPEGGKIDIVYVRFRLAAALRSRAVDLERLLQHQGQGRHHGDRHGAADP